MSGILFRRALAGLAIAGASLLMGAGPVIQQNDALQAQVNNVIGLSQSTVVALDLDFTVGQAQRVAVPIDGETYELILAPHSIRAAGYRLIIQKADGSYEDVEPGPVRTMRGIVSGHLTSKVAANLLDEGLEARIDLGDGRVIWMEPVAAHIYGADPSLHVMYESQDVAGSPGECAVEGFNMVKRPESLNAAGQRGGLCTCELACDADFDYYTDRGSSVPNVESRINGVINGMNPQYESECGITYVITTIIVRTAEPDPYSSTDAGTLLDQFRNHWQSSQGGIHRDEAELFTGKNMSGGVIGIAFLNGICNSNAYNVVEDISPLSCRTDLSAHECGHNWSADHCCPGTTMNPSLTCANSFSQQSINEITGYLASRGCIDCGPEPVAPALSAVAVAGTGANLATADVRVVIDPADWWTVGGVTNGAAGLAPLAPGVDLHVQLDPNGNPVMTGIGGGGNPGNAHTFVSLPFDQFSTKRFGTAGAASFAGAYDPLGPTPILNSSQINIAFLQFPPSSDGAGVDDDAYIVRITLDLTGTAYAGQTVVVSDSGPPGGFPETLGEFEVASASHEFTAPLTTYQFGFYTTTPDNCTGDFDGDNDRDLTDLAVMLANYGTLSGADPEDGDMDFDGDVDLTDLSLFLALYGEPC